MKRMILKVVLFPIKLAIIVLVLPFVAIAWALEDTDNGDILW